MSKLVFFKKGSRKSKPEQNLFNEVNRLIQSDPDYASRVKAYVDQHGHAKNGEELMKLKMAVNSSGGSSAASGAKEKSAPKGENIQTKTKVETPPEEPVSKAKIQPDKSGKYGEFSEVVQDIKEREAAPTGGFDPFKKPVIERSYTGVGTPEEKPATQDVPTEGGESSGADGGADIPASGDGGGGDIPPTNAGGASDIPTGGGGDIPSTGQTQEDLPEAGYSNTKGDGDVDTSDMGEDITQKDDGLGGDNLKDLSAGQKKKAAEKTAEVLLKGYKSYGTAHWKAMARMSKKKVDLLILQGRVNPNQVVQDNVTVKNYVKAWNEEVQAVFTPSDEALEAIREPLVEVLLEQGLALTPTQRLVWAVAENQIEMGAKAFQFLRTKKDTLAAFIKYNDGASRKQQSSMQKEKVVKATQEEEMVYVPPDDEDSTFEEIVENLVDDEEGNIETVEAEEVTAEEV